MSRTPFRYVERLFQEELEKARSKMFECSGPLAVAVALSKEYGFELPPWTNSFIFEGEFRPAVQEALDVEMEARGATDSEVRPEMPSMTQAVLEYFQRNTRVAEPSDVDQWVRRTYQADDLREYAIAETMSRMARDGRLYSFRFPGEQSSLYGLPSWALPGEHPARGFRPKFLPMHLRPPEPRRNYRPPSGDGSRGRPAAPARNPESANDTDLTFTPDDDLPF
jgi:hypothetical protein